MATSDEGMTVNNLLECTFIREKGDLSQLQITLINIFAYGIQQATHEAVVEVARQLDSLCPPLEQESAANDYLWMVWDIMLDIARSPEATSEIHIRLVAILESLLLVAKGVLNVWGDEQRVWRDFPQLSICMEACFSDPMSNSEEPGEWTPMAAQIWWNINSFAARCLGDGVVGPYIDVMYAMRSALEEDLTVVPEMIMMDCKIQVACEWISHAAKALLW